MTRRYVRLPLWLWTTLWALQLLGSDDRWDALAAALFIVAGFVPSPYEAALDGTWHCETCICEDRFAATLNDGAS